MSKYKPISLVFIHIWNMEIVKILDQFTLKALIFICSVLL
jgi:hypothetical protein